MKDNTTNSEGRCSMCGHSPLVPKLIDTTIEYGADDESITVTAHQVPVRVCANCGEYYSGREAARVEHDAICQALGLMTPGEIKALRDRFGWSQKDLAALTGLGIATISRCECGRLVPNRSTNVILLGLRDCAPFREYREGLLTGNQTKLGATSTSAKVQTHAAHANRLAAGNGGNSSAVTPIKRIKTRHSSFEEYAAIAKISPSFKLNDYYHRSKS